MEFSDIWTSKEIIKKVHPELGEMHVAIKMIKLQIYTLTIVATKHIKTDYIDVDYFMIELDHVTHLEFETN